MTDEGSSATTLADLRGFQCPLPVLKTRSRLRKMQVGERLEVLSDDPLAGVDIPHFCNEYQQVLIEQGEVKNGALRFVIERSAHKI